MAEEAIIRRVRFYWREGGLLRCNEFQYEVGDLQEMMDAADGLQAAFHEAIVLRGNTPVATFHDYEEGMDMLLPQMEAAAWRS